MVNINNMTKRITIYEETDGFNEETGRQGKAGLSPVRTVWSAVKHVKGSEYFAAAAENRQSTVRFTCRYQPDIVISTKHLVEYKNVLYDIKAINNPDETNEVLILTCEESEKVLEADTDGE